MVSANGALSCRDTEAQRMRYILCELIGHEPGDILVHDFCLVIYPFDGEEDLPE